MEKEFQIALSLDPDSATTLQLYAVFLAIQLRLDEAIERAEAAARLAPTSGLMAHTIALAHFHAGHFDEAIAASRRALDLDRGFISAPGIIARAYTMKGMHRQATETLLASAKGIEIRSDGPWAAHHQALAGNKQAGSAAGILRRRPARLRRSRPWLRSTPQGRQRASDFFGWDKGNA